MKSKFCKFENFLECLPKILDDISIFRSDFYFHMVLLKQHLFGLSSPPPYTINRFILAHPLTCTCIHMTGEPAGWRRNKTLQTNKKLFGLPYYSRLRSFWGKVNCFHLSLYTHLSSAAVLLIGFVKKSSSKGRKNQVYWINEYICLQTLMSVLVTCTKITCVLGRKAFGQFKSFDFNQISNTMFGRYQYSNFVQPWQWSIICSILSWLSLRMKNSI